MEDNKKFYKIIGIADGGKYYGRTLSFIARINSHDPLNSLECLYCGEPDWLFESLYEDLYDHIESGKSFDDFDIHKWAREIDYEGSIREDGAYLIVQHKEITEENYNNSSHWKNARLIENKIVYD